MKDTKTEKTQVDARELFERAKADIAADMKSRGIGAILWAVGSVNFHYLPEVVVGQDHGKDVVVTVSGIYRVGDDLYLMEQGVAPRSVDDYYNKNTEVRPDVVTLTEKQALQQLGTPDSQRGFTRQGTVQQWLTIADCYFEALTLTNDV